MERITRLTISTVLCCVLFSAAMADTKPEGAAYLWHRVRGPKAAEVLKTFHNWRIYALFAEFRTEKPGAMLKYLPGTVPVIRLDQFCWQRNDFLNSFLPILQQLPSGEIQLDCDVPESKIAAYADFLKTLKSKMKSYSFSVTLLPCHLKHKTLNAVLEQTDYAVLQLHALEVPPNLPEEYKLFDLVSADKAVSEMKKFRKPFRIALPSYAYTIHYAKDGKFRRMSAENGITLRKDEIHKVAAPKWEDVLKLRRKYPELEVIWFRLPMKGDRLALEPENLIRLNHGNLPRMEIEVIRKKNKNFTDIYWKNHGMFGRVRDTMNLDLFEEHFFFNGACAVAKNKSKIMCELPPPGETRLVARTLNGDKNKK